MSLSTPVAGVETGDHLELQDADMANANGVIAGCAADFDLSRSRQAGGLDP